MENTPAAAPSTEAIPQTETPTTDNTATESTQAQAPAIAAADVASYLGTTPETLQKFMGFVKANGEFDKAYSKMRTEISNPRPKQSGQAETQLDQQGQQTGPSQSTQNGQTEAPVRRQQPPKGYASLQELAVERYFRDLAGDPKYANIAEQITNGDALKEMLSMGMNPIDEDYNININQVNQFLTLKAASVPAKQTSAEPTNIPTVDYITVAGDTIANSDQALDVLQQSFLLRQQGQAPHPLEEKAKEFLKNSK